MKEKLKERKGITLIALVITIIVLLILAGVSIAMLTGENGILNQANKAKTETEYKGAEEKVKLAIMGARADDGQMTVEELTREIGYQGGTLTGDAFPVEVTVDGHTFTVENSGKIIGNDTLGTVTGTETTNTMVKDKLGNIVKVPAGFKVVNPTETVPDGIIIEDVSHEATKGSQFVWIPVGTVKKSDGQTETITLSRYTFDDNGQETDQVNKSITDGRYNYQELATSDKGNTTAKNLEEFKTKASKGYYIGRYEARDKDTETARTSSTSDANQLVCTEDNYVYNYVTQPQAANLSRDMYSDSNFESDLINSYAWDTAITFLQKLDNRADKTKPYSRQKSLNRSLATQGTNKLSTQDKICNIFDMASNAAEWTTETSGVYGYHCARGGYYFYPGSLSTSSRYCYDFTNFDYDNYAFRPLLYLEN